MAQQEISWPKAALVAIIIIVIVAAGAFVLLRRAGSSGEKVRFYSRVYFYLIGTEDNGPLENVEIIALPDPSIDNKVLGSAYVPNGVFWTLYANTDNGPVVEVDQGVVKQLVGPRTSTIEFTGIGGGPSVFGPKVKFVEVNGLYPSEILEVRQWLEIPADMADRLTLRDTGLIGGSTCGLIYSVPAKKINGSIFAGLYKVKDDNTLQKVEEFMDTAENVQTVGWWGLAPI